jgi:type I restriction enzyme S subunit
MTYPIQKLWDLFDITSSKRVFKSEWKNKWVPFYRAREIVKLAKDWFVDNDLFITEEMFEEYSNKYWIPKEWDIMVTWVWTLGVCYLVKEKDKFYFKDWNIIWLKQIWIDVDSRYIEYWFQSEIIKMQVNQTTWTSVWTYTIVRAKNTKIPIPPLPTQKRIVQKLDSSFEKIDKSIEITKKNLENLEQLNKSVLEEVFRECEYDIKNIDDISHNVQYWYTWKTIEKWNYKYLRITDIQDNNIIWDNVPYVDITENEANKYKLNKWDIVFARTWATVWKSCLIDEVWVGNVFASYLIRIIWKQNLVNPKFMQYFFYSKNYWEQIGFDVVWAAQPNFNWTKLKQVKIPLPLLPKQKEIVTYLDKIFEKNKSLKSEYERKLKDLEELKQSLLKEAFEWRLVKE